MATLLCRPAPLGHEHVAAGIEDRIRLLCVGAAALAGLGMTGRALEACDEIATLRDELTAARRANGNASSQDRRPIAA